MDARDVEMSATGVLDDAGARLVGGHTSEGAELSLGFSITAFAREDALLRKGGMRPGDSIACWSGHATGVRR